MSVNLSRPQDVSPRQLGQTDQVSAEVVTALAATGYPSMRNVHCETRGDVLILRGTVPSYYLKQTAQNVAAKIPGVTRVVNHLTVGSEL